VKKIFVSGIKDEIENEDLREYFSELGEIVEVDVIVDKDTKRKRGFAFVQFDDYDPVDKAVCEYLVYVDPLTMTLAHSVQIPVSLKVLNTRYPSCLLPS